MRRAARAAGHTATLGLLWLVVPAAVLGASYWQAWMHAAPRPTGSPPISRTNARLLAALPAALVPSGAHVIVGLRRAAVAGLSPDAPPLQLLAAADRAASRDDSARLCARAAHGFVCATITVGAHPGVQVVRSSVLSELGGRLGPVAGAEVAR